MELGRSQVSLVGVFTDQIFLNNKIKAGKDFFSMFLEKVL